MSKIKFKTTAYDFDLFVNEGECIAETLRRANIPIQCCIIVNEDGDFVSVSHKPQSTDKLIAYSLRNHDFDCLSPEYTMVRRPAPAVELIRPINNAKHLGLFQFSREEAFEFISKSVETVLETYMGVREYKAPFQVALSPGGDGRVLIECLGRFRAKHPSEDFHCVIVAVGFEDEREHIENAEELARRFDFSYSSFGVRAAADLLGYTSDLQQLSVRFRDEYPHDEAEVMLTFWVQELNRKIAKSSGRSAVLFGFNQEDVIAEKLYQAMSGAALPSLPIRRVDEFDIIAPLAYVPKKMLDAMDLTNSLRNYRMRTPSVSYLRSSLYFLAYHMVEAFPAVADMMVSSRLQPDDPNLILNWLTKNGGMG